MNEHNQAPGASGDRQRAVIVDDGEFYIELNDNVDACIAPGFLQRRCYVGVTTPGGYECVGSFQRDARGLWHASIDALYDQHSGSDSRSMGQFTQRLDAIVALWQCRHEAHCRHKDV